MLFNSYEFLFLFLPVTVAGFAWLNRKPEGRHAVAFMCAASIVFYGWWDYRYLALLSASILWNWWIGTRLIDAPSSRRLAAGITVNLLVLGYYKYANFFVSTAVDLTGADWHVQNIVLPLGISFFTFTQIAFLVDAHQGKVGEKGFLNYVLFVTFFPHLMAGPILHHKEMMPQFAHLQGKRPEPKVVAQGLFLLVVGLFKKVVVADTLARYVDAPFANVASMQIMDAWTATLGYTLQLYFDFSGYSEMAMGIALLFGIALPLNFNSPYKANNIADFWKRWHMTLSRFLRDYLYIPLGGNRRGFATMLFALAATMVLGGLWHGAGWQYLVWGALHGALLIAHRLWTRAGFRLPAWLGRAITFTCVLFAWVMFRANNVRDGLLIWKKMLGLDGIVLPVAFRAAETGSITTAVSPFINGVEIAFMAVLLCFCMTCRNVHEHWDTWAVPRRRRAFALTALAAVAMFSVNAGSQFLYWGY